VGKERLGFYKETTGNGQKNHSHPPVVTAIRKAMRHNTENNAQNTTPTIQRANPASA